jgi:predicted Ser/Thr protein kinase
MSVDLEPLLSKLAELAPRFGRARADLEAMVSRGRAGDYRGVMQNARLVLETLLRSLITDELKQTPGKAGLEELVARFRREPHAGVVPMNILAHMGTVQAWGNLSAHDHKGSLDESMVFVGKEEVLPSLNSMVSILGWYATRRGLTPPPPQVEPTEALSATHKTEGPTPGKIIAGRYRLDARLAGGGMGEVYEATHLELGRKLALKLMRPELSKDASFVERFRREAMTASRLGHPHIVDIIDSGRSDDGQFFFVMEFLDGKTIGKLVDEGPVALPVALELVTQIAEALDVAHSAGVVHRDLKPENVIVLERSGRRHVKLVDFGIAKVVTSVDQKVTTQGLIMGTPQYMAPEQAAGLAVDARSDIYALGLIIFELLTGHPPLTGETAALVMSAHITKAAPPLPAQFPSALRALVARMLAKEPTQRPQTMAEVLASLASSPKDVARRPKGLLIGAGLAVVAALVAVLAWPRETPTPPPEPVRPPPVVAAPVVMQPVVPEAVVDAGVVAVAPVAITTVVDAGVVAIKRRPPPAPRQPVAPKTNAPALLPAEGL